MVHDTDIVELELKSKKFSLAVRKKEALEKAEPVYQVPSNLSLKSHAGITADIPNRITLTTVIMHSQE